MTLRVFSLVWDALLLSFLSSNGKTLIGMVKATPGLQGYAVIKPDILNISVGRIAQFNCQIYNSAPNFVIWSLNGTQIQHYYPDVDMKTNQYILSSDSVLSTLKIWVSTNSGNVLNNSKINCEGLVLAESTYSSIYSMTSELRVQGPLSAPKNLTALFLHNCLFVQWIPPFTFLGVDIIGYLIETKSVSGSVNQQFSTNGTQNSFAQSEINCTNYQVCVSAETAAGVGEEACILITRIPGVLGSLDNHRVEVMAQKHGNTSLLQEFYPTTCSEYEELERLNSSNFLEEAELNLTSDGSIQPLQQNDSFLKFNWSLPSFTINNNIVFTNISLLEISNHVLDILIKNSNSGSVVECVFTQYSSTTLCLLTITCENVTQNLTTNCELKLMKGSSSLLPPCQFKCSSFTISAFDIINNVTSDNPSVTKNKVVLNFTSVQPTLAHYTSKETITLFQSTTTGLTKESQDFVFFFAIILIYCDLILILIICCSCLSCCVVYYQRRNRNYSSADLTSFSETTSGLSETAELQKHYPRQKQSPDCVSEVNRLDLQAETLKRQTVYSQQKPRLEMEL